MFLSTANLPVGTVKYFTGEIPPEFFYCDGSWVSSIDYIDLFNHLGGVQHYSKYYNKENNTFKLPDYRGFFLRSPKDIFRIDVQQAEKSNFLEHVHIVVLQGGDHTTHDFYGYSYTHYESGGWGSPFWFARAEIYGESSYECSSEGSAHTHKVTLEPFGTEGTENYPDHYKYIAGIKW